jgi:negative regulator of flagellin synthesis FlgM
MKIDDKDNTLINVLRQYQDSVKTGSKPDKKVEEKTAPNEKVNLSATAKDIQTLKSAIASLPNVRQDKVDELRARIEKGEYSASGEKIADKIIEEFLLDRTGR